MAVTLYPGMGLGRIDRPRIAFTLGFDPAGSALAPIYVVSSEPAFSASSSRLANAVSMEGLIYVRTEREAIAISEEGVESIKSEARPDTVVSKLPPEHVKSEEPDE